MLFYEMNPGGLTPGTLGIASVASLIRKGIASAPVAYCPCQPWHSSICSKESSRPHASVLPPVLFWRSVGTKTPSKECLNLVLRRMLARFARAACLSLSCLIVSLVLGLVSFSPFINSGDSEPIDASCFICNSPFAFMQLGRCSSSSSVVGGIPGRARIQSSPPRPGSASVLKSSVKVMASRWIHIHRHRMGTQYQVASEPFLRT